jgi:hypothetical protein
MTTIGSSSTVITLTTPNVTLTGPVDAYGLVGTFLANGTLTPFDAAILGPAAGHFTITNTGLVESHGTSTTNKFDAGILLGGAGTLTNKGTILGAQGVAMLGTAGADRLTNSGLIEGSIGIAINLAARATLGNSGTILSTEGTAIYLLAGGSLGNTGHITAYRNGIDAEYGPATVTNTGTIIATADTFISHGTTAISHGIRLHDGGIVRNQQGGTIAGAGGIAIEGTTAAYVYNAGLVAAGTHTAIYLDVAGTVINAKTGSILSGGAGIVLETGGTADNAGLIRGDGTGIAVKSGAATNTGTILLTGHEVGIYLAGSAGVAAYNGKTGRISAATGIELGANGNVTNNGAIEVTIGNGLFLAAGGTITNGGLITASDPFIGGGDGIALVGGGRIVNTGTIYGANNAIQVTQGGTIVDSGTLIGGRDAIYFGVFGSTSNLLILSPTAHTTGTVFGGGGRLELEADGTKIGTAAPAQFTDFASVTIESKAIWDMAGTFLTSLGLTLVNDGTIKESAADLITISGAIEGTGLIDLSKQAFTLEGSIAAGQTIAFTGTAETLGLANPQDFHAKIEHFSIGDTIQLEGVPKTSIATTHFAGGVLTLTGDGHTVDITFASPASFGTDVFVLTAEGANTALTLKKPAMSILSPTTPPAATTLPTLSPPAASTPTTPAAALTTSVPTPLGIATALLHQSPTTLPPITLQP